jgi:hypothetical protein
MMKIVEMKAILRCLHLVLIVQVYVRRLCYDARLSCASLSHLSRFRRNNEADPVIESTSGTGTGTEVPYHDRT